MAKERILIVDDEERMREMISEYISVEDYEVDEAANGAEALNKFMRNQYSLIILDVMMPKIDGWGVCKEIRKTSQVPIIMLTARGEEYDKLFGFELGVDDYLVKPFSPRELLARIKAIIRRSSTVDESPSIPETITIEGLVIECASRNVYVDGEPVNLTPKEYELLCLFAQNPKRVFTREQLLNAVWGYDYKSEDRTVDTHIKTLRESLKDYRRLIVTVWGTGYKFETTAK
ncbi:response regulator transcription factor [Bacillus marasmi]|uniref:response regulator transcription factor n=1 Tax=Bacillus marasmi TaxID=1926279 RepID=UPI0011C76B29|nr:response regulator transcription factor [Bacillus marasmi]